MVRKVYSKQLGQVIYDECSPCSLGDVEFFRKGGKRPNFGNVQYFPGSMGGFNPLAAIEAAVKQTLPHAGQDVINAFLNSSDGKDLATQVASTAAQVGEQAATAQAANTLAQNQAYYQQQIAGLSAKLKANWQTILMVGGGVALLGLVIFLAKKK